MIHLGDITKISGYDAPVVDIITGGSPCQDLSVAGKRAGLAGERSGLFMEQIRIIKEMREKERSNGRTNDAIRPRYMVWENVPGAFSSNKGEDFRAVLEETAKVAERDACIPGSPNGKWPSAGCIMGDGWSIAWRLHDAQFWGVPQRRKRIALVADFGGSSAPEILFERKGLPRDIETSEEQRQSVAGNVRPSTAETGRAISFQERAEKPGGGKGILIQEEHTGALSTFQNQRVLDTGAGKQDSEHSGVNLTQGAVGFPLGFRAENTKCYEEKGTTLCNGTRPGYTCGIIDIEQKTEKNSMWDGAQVVPTLTANNAGGGQRMPDKNNFNAIITYGLDRASFNQGENAKYNFSIEEELIGAQTARGPGAVYHSVVRRLTPLECERLQGYPDYWTDIGDWVDSKGKVHKGESDSPRYKALGNSIALPFWKWMAKRMVKYLDIEHATMASLFDGIGGFPIAYSEAGCEPVWASEIEEFPIAVTKIRFPE